MNLAFLSTALAACTHTPPGTNADLRLNDVQVIGSHNSYRRIPPQSELLALNALRSGLGDELAYDHPPLQHQLEVGVRQFEMDIFADPDGQWHPEGGQGFKVMHIAGLDERSHCRMLRDCLIDIRNWSDRHPRHLPLILTIDAKDFPTNLPGERVPVTLTTVLLDALDAELREGLGADRLLTPDEVRGQAGSLREAVTDRGWPLLEAVRGKVLVIFDVRPELAELYRLDHANLAGRSMFSLYDETDREAAVFIVQNPRGSEEAIASWVRKGFLVRTRSDASTREARAADRSMLKAAQRSGAQIISTDYYPGAPDPLGFGFVVSLKDGKTMQCNPVRRPHGCRLDPE
ncbi:MULTISPECIES: Ca2+-dependent phosphoinositide-specific phospholipase C [unclassified Novosphingobium]|uniref:Ca2+-dependent phosphoinositide-specific phospholipase C n=1 Tax=unclassified Novosphingobium TaxID=2644732 RepID=UPI0025EC7E4D|nr:MULTISPECIES: Ca2+-dependent phosphoinositide-specific phospholipase C [unclassified Novosphingobium]HQS69200.1 Ca2+-dependent phosphoinositide-specific phospholipase C [Novosphingobium sp.]